MLHKAVNGQQANSLSHFSETLWFLAFSAEYITFPNISKIITPMECFHVSKLIYKDPGLAVHVKEAVWGPAALYKL